ncbi:TPA: hypothetical protein ACH3X2_009823 [Trebouxia sp. C0005]
MTKLRSANLECAEATIDGSQGKLSDHGLVQYAPTSHALARIPTASSREIVFFSQRYRADDGPKQHAAVYLLQVPIVLLAMITRWTSLHSNCQLWRSRADSKLLLVRCPVVNRALEVNTSTSAGKHAGGLEALAN